MALRTFTARRVRARLAGSSWPILVETDAGLFVAKLRGAAQGVPALIAEIIVAELALALGLPVPERALITLEADTPTLDRNDEFLQLLDLSRGLNLGLRYLAGASVPRPEHLAKLDDDFVARVLWLDGLTMNPDRTPHNPNILLWHQRPWLIDHGAALPFQYAWSAVTEQSPREPSDYIAHVFGARAHLLREYDERLAEMLDKSWLARAVAQVPDDFMARCGADADVTRSGLAYQAFLWKRLKAPRPFTQSP